MLARNPLWHRSLKLFEEAQCQKTPGRDLADRLTPRVIPAVVSVDCRNVGNMASATYTGLVQISSLPHQYQRERYLHSLTTALWVLVVACPCALGFAASIAVMVGAGVGSRLGVFTRGGGLGTRSLGERRCLQHHGHHHKRSPTCYKCSDSSWKLRKRCCPRC